MPELPELAHEIADAIVNEHGYTNDPGRAEERDRIEVIVARTLASELAPLTAEIREALEGDSNDAEHDALVRVAEVLGV